MEQILNVAEFGVAAFGAFAVALLAAKVCLEGLFRAMSGGR